MDTDTDNYTEIDTHVDIGMDTDRDTDMDTDTDISIPTEKARFSVFLKILSRQSDYLPSRQYTVCDIVITYLSHQLLTIHIKNFHHAGSGSTNLTAKNLCRLKQNRRKYI
jgi:hypothetical protein